MTEDYRGIVGATLEGLRMSAAYENRSLSDLSAAVDAVRQMLRSTETIAVPKELVKREIDRSLAGIGQLIAEMRAQASSKERLAHQVSGLLLRVIGDNERDKADLLINGSMAYIRDDDQRFPESMTSWMETSLRRYVPYKIYVEAHDARISDELHYHLVAISEDLGFRKNSLYPPSCLPSVSGA
jgi:hypothetical protein